MLMFYHFSYLFEIMSENYKLIWMSVDTTWTINVVILYGRRFTSDDN